MSMWLELARLGSEGQKALASDEDAACRAIFFNEGTPPTGFESTHSMGLDYRTLLAMVEGMEEAGIECRWTRCAFGEGEDLGSALEFEFTYGPAFAFSPKEVVTIAEGLATEEWDPEDDFEENIARFFALAAKAGQAVVGGVN